MLSGDRFMDFMKWFTLIYTSILWKALVSWSLITPTAAPWLEEVKTWWAAVVGTAFFVNIHVVLQVPFTTEIWRWVVYALLALLQMLMSAVVQRTVPMVMGALGAFVVAWKIGFEVSEALQFGSREVQYLTTFAIIGLEGVGIILAAIAFARNRDKVQDWVRVADPAKRRPSRRINLWRDTRAVDIGARYSRRVSGSGAGSRARALRV